MYSDIYEKSGLSVFTISTFENGSSTGITLHSVKGHVKCQETVILSKWSELVIDHR